MNRPLLQIAYLPSSRIALPERKKLQQIAGRETDQDGFIVLKTDSKTDIDIAERFEAQVADVLNRLYYRERREEGTGTVVHSKRCSTNLPSASWNPCKPEKAYTDVDKAGFYHRTNNPELTHHEDEYITRRKQVLKQEAAREQIHSPVNQSLIGKFFKNVLHWEQ